MTKRSPERKEWLTDLMTTAIEHGGYGFSHAIEYEPFADEPYALIVNRYGDDMPESPYRVTVDTMAKGLSVLHDLVSKSGNPPSGWVKELFKSGQTNGDDGDYDVIGALAVLECAIFGDITYG